MEDQKDLLTRLDERMAFIQEKIVRIEEAVFGNGKPGIRQEVSEHSRRLTEIEHIEKGCPIFYVEDRLKEIQDRHNREDAVAKKEEETREKEMAEFRKFKWALLATIASTIVGILANFIK